MKPLWTPGIGPSTRVDPAQSDLFVVRRPVATGSDPLGSLPVLFVGRVDP